MKFFKRIIYLLIVSSILLASCDLPGLGGGQSKNSVKISALATSESQIMAYMLKDLIEHDTKGKITGSIINNLGSATIQHNALLRGDADRSEEHTSELQSRFDLVCRLLLETSSYHLHLHSFPTRRSSDLGGQSKNSVKISALATSESQIMAYMLKDLIEHDTKGKITGSIINNLGSATIQHNALLRGDAD